MPQENEYLTRAEVAKLFRVNKETVARWTRAGRLPVVRISHKTVRYMRSEIDRVLREQSESAAAK